MPLDCSCPHAHLGRSIAADVSGHVSTKIAGEVNHLRFRPVHRLSVCILEEPQARADPNGRDRDRECCVDAEGEDHGMLRTLNKLLQPACGPIASAIENLR